jgi:hypothetical protein
MSKKETIEEFLARGGKITKCDPAPLPDEGSLPKASPTSVATSTMMTLAEGALYYAESRAKPKERKKKEDVIESINFAALPASLLKYMPKKN